MFAPAAPMSQAELQTTLAQTVSGVRLIPVSAPAYVTAAHGSSAPEEVESIAMLSQMLQNEAQRHQREHRVITVSSADDPQQQQHHQQHLHQHHQHHPPSSQESEGPSGISSQSSHVAVSAAGGEKTSSSDVLSQLIESRVVGGGDGSDGSGSSAPHISHAVYLEPAGGGQATLIDGRAVVTAAIGGLTAGGGVTTATIAGGRLNIDQLLTIPGFGGATAIAPHFLAAGRQPSHQHLHSATVCASTGAILVGTGDGDGILCPQPAHRSGGTVIAKENGRQVATWLAAEIKREPLTAPGGVSVGTTEEAARGLLALHKQHCDRLTGEPMLDGDELKRKAHMARHRRTHTNERPHICTVCYKGFIRREHLQRHLKIHEPGYVPARPPPPSEDHRVRPFVCAYCGRGFLRRYHLQRHVDTQGTCPALSNPDPANSAAAADGTEPPTNPPVRHPCDLCGSTFLRREHMKRHRKTHTGKKEHACYLCGKAFFRREHVRKHVLSHTRSPGTGRGAAAGAGASSQAQQIITVNVQELTGADSQSRITPSLLLEPQQPAVATAAVGPTRSAAVGGVGGAAGGLAAVQQPTRRGSNPDQPRNHVCRECGRRFGRKEHLQRHESTHSGTRPFQCSVCQRGFNRKEHLRKHLQSPPCCGGIGIHHTTASSTADDSSNAVMVDQVLVKREPAGSQVSSQLSQLVQAHVEAPVSVMTSGGSSGTSAAHFHALGLLPPAATHAAVSVAQQLVAPVSTSCSSGTSSPQQLQQSTLLAQHLTGAAGGYVVASHHHHHHPHHPHHHQQHQQLHHHVLDMSTSGGQQTTADAQAASSASAISTAAGEDQQPLQLLMK